MLLSIPLQRKNESFPMKSHQQNVSEHNYKGPLTANLWNKVKKLNKSSICYFYWLWWFWSTVLFWRPWRYTAVRLSFWYKLCKLGNTSNSQERYGTEIFGNGLYNRKRNSHIPNSTTAIFLKWTLLAAQQTANSCIHLWFPVQYCQWLKTGKKLISNCCKAKRWLV